MITRACKCGGLIAGGECSRCKLAHRRTSADRGYRNDWRRVRRHYLESNPLCHDCIIRGEVSEANEVHHVRKVSNRPDLRLNWGNLMGLCTECHAVRTAKGE